MQVYRKDKIGGGIIKASLLGANNIENSEGSNTVDGEWNIAYGQSGVFAPGSSTNMDLSGGATYTALAAYSGMLGGWGNKMAGYMAVILGGSANEAYADNCGVVGGYANNVFSPSYGTVIGGGAYNTTDGNYNFVSGYKNDIRKNAGDANSNGLNFVGGGHHFTNGFGNFLAGSGHRVIGGFAGVVGQAAKEVNNSLTQNTPEALRFVVGNGTINQNTFVPVTRFNALEIFQSGLGKLPTVDNAKIDAADGKAIVTKEYLQANAGITIEGVYPDNETAYNVGLVALGKFYRTVVGAVMQVFQPIIDAAYQADFDTTFRSADGSIYRWLITHRDYIDGGTLYKHNGTAYSQGIAVPAFNGADHLLMTATNNSDVYKFVPNEVDSVNNPANFPSSGNLFISGILPVSTTGFCMWRPVVGDGQENEFGLGTAEVGLTQEELLSRKFDTNSIVYVDLDAQAWTWV